MEILVNREPLDFTLEKESSVGEVVDGLAQWLGEGQFAITSLDVNTATYAIHDRSAWADISLDEVERLSVEAMPLTQVDHATLVALDQYFSLLVECLTRRNAEPLPELAEELPYVRRRIAQFVPSLANPDGSVDLLHDPALETGALPSPERGEELMGQIRNIRAILETREREYRQPVAELGFTLGQLRAMAEQLVEVPVQLQTGHEADAMQTVVTLTELLGRVVRLVPLVEGSNAQPELDMARVRAFAEELAPHLAELKEAFEAQDSVLLGDLLEYELAPRLESLNEVLPDAARAGGTDPGEARH